MKKHFKKMLSFVLTIVMTLSIVPWSQVKAKAFDIPGYSAGAAVAWAEAHLYDISTPLLGYGVWDNGGDCTNFISQALYMGGLDMTGTWHSNGLLRYHSGISDGVFIRAQQFHDYLVSLGGQSIQNPSASQLSVGDVIFFRRGSNLRLSHSVIVVAIENGAPVIASHSIRDKATGVYDIKRTTNWHLEFAASDTFLVKLYGDTCVATKSRNFDVYIANKSTGLYGSPGYSYIRNVLSSDYIHVYETKYKDGYKWGYTFCRGSYGWVKLSDCKYMSHQTTPSVSHDFDAWYVVKRATCVEEGYEQRVCKKCGYTEKNPLYGGHVTIDHATCLQPGFCSLCGVKTEEPLGHSYGEWDVFDKPTCTEYGEKRHNCVRCNYQENEPVDPLGHDLELIITSATCVDNGTATYDCTRCDYTTVGYESEGSTWSDWTEEVRTDIPAEKIQTKTQYRYRDKSTQTSYSTSIDGWTRDGYTGVVQKNKATLNYVKSWHAGFDKNSGYYRNYNVTPMKAVDNETTKCVIHSEVVSGYIYWHWCRNRYISDGPYNSLISDGLDATEKQTYHTFHAFEHSSLFSPAYSGANYCYHSNGSLCKDSYVWLLPPITIYKQTYSTYKKLYNYYKWSDWSSWQDETVESAENREIEERTLYKYDLAALGHDFSVEDDSMYKAPTCTEPGYIGMKCSRCGAFSPDTKVIPALGHILYDEPEYGDSREELLAQGKEAPFGYWYFSFINSKEESVYRRDCGRECGYHEFKTKGNCLCLLTETVERTCTQDGEKIYTCKEHGETMTQITEKAYGHEADGVWIITALPSCANGGTEGEKYCKCVRHDDGVTCDEIFVEKIPALEHQEVVVDGKEPTCTEEGRTAETYCGVCNETIVESEVIPALGHDDSGEWTKADPPGCGESAYEYLYCIREHDGEKCNALIDEREIKGPDPDYQIINTVESTCTEQGYIEYTCMNCVGTDHEHGFIEDLPLDPTKHGEGEWETIQEGEICEIPKIQISICPHCGDQLDMKETPPQYEKHNYVVEELPSTCTGAGVKKEYCTQCGHVKSIEDPDPLGHDLGEWVVVKEPTCIDLGTERRECQREGCAYYEERYVDAIGHDYKLVETNDATCTQPANEVWVCANDASHNYTVEKGSPLGHECDENWVLVKEPTCAEEGEEQSKCVRHDNGETCDKVYTRPVAIEPDAHAWGEWEVVTEPTCETEGLEQRICNNDPSHVEMRPVDAIGHKWDDGVIDPESTCTDCGTKTYTCENDANHTYTEQVPMNPDNHDGGENIKDDSVPTCTEDGYTGDTYCSGCGEKLTSGEVIPATGHAWGEWEVVTEPTCETEGLEQRICNNDPSHVETRPIDAIGHKWDDGEVKTEPTCNSEGTKLHTCENDPEHQYMETLPANPENHDGGEEIRNDKAPTCTEDGYTGDTYCSGCDEKLTSGEVIPAHGHDYHKIDDKCVAPDYDVSGYDYFECSHDASHNYTVEIPALVKDTFTATFITTAPFFTEDKVVGTVEFEKGEKYVDEPDVDVYTNYTFAWDEYELNDEDIVIYGRYTPVESDEITELEPEKDAEYSDGVVKITLEAKADTKNIKILSKKTKPVDIVLVLDQSGSMAEQLSSDGTTKQEALIDCANKFVDALYENAVATGADHRIAVVGFAYSDYNNGKYVNTGILATTDGKSVNYANLDDSVYSKALIPVVSANGVNANITKGINSVAASGATAADLGLEIAQNIYAANPKDENRERIILFITDGTPTSWGETTDLVQNVSASAIEKANAIKNEQGAKIYSIGVHANADPTAEFTSDDDGVVTDNRNAFISFDFNRFLHAVSSNYPDAESMYVSELGNGSKDSGFYMAVNDTENLNDIFTSILYSAVYVITTFDKVTLVDTVSADFTLTLEQEAEMRENLINNYGIRNEDITVVRNADGTTTVKFENIRAKKVYNTDGSSYYSAKVSFSVSANENTLNGGNFATNTDNSGIEIGGERVEKFEVPTVDIPANRNIIVFTIDGVVYRIDEADLGDKVEIPETDLAEWNIHTGTSVVGNYAVFEAGAEDPGHTEGEWTVLTEPTCITSGEEELKCLFCNEVIATRELATTTHTEGEWITITEATCTTAGYAELRCVHCKELLDSKEIESRGEHLAGEWTVSVEATCTENGVEEQICTECGEIIGTREIIAVGHVAKEGYSSDKSSHWKECDCGEVLETSTHSLEWIIKSPPSCVEQGIMNEECEVCGYVSNSGITISKIPHSAVKTPAVDSTCVAEGNIEYYTCVVCEKIFADEMCANEISSEDIIVEKVEHPWGEWSEPQNGVSKRECSYCDAEEQKIIDEDEFDFSLLKLLRGTASMKSYKGEDYVAITMTPGKTATGIYKEMYDGGTVELVDICGNIQDRAGDYVAYQSQNSTNPVATMIITYADGTTETYPVVFELYEMEREIPFNPAEKFKPVRGTVSMGTDAKGEYILVEMNDAQSSVGIYKATLDGLNATLDGTDGTFTEQEKLYIFYGSQNTINPEGRFTVTEADGSAKTYRVVFRMYEMDATVNAAKGLRPVRGAVTFDADGAIRIKMSKGQKSVGLSKTMANGATFELVDANGRMTNNPSAVMFYMTNNTANVTATIIFTLPDGTTKEQKIIFDMGLADNPDPLTYLKAIRGTISYQNDGTEDYIEVKANEGASGVGIYKDSLVKYTITDVNGELTDNATNYYIYKSKNPDGLAANINFLQSDGSYKTYKIKFVF